VSDGTPTLYEWAGGTEALERLTETFYGKVREDPLLEPVFRHMDSNHPKHVAAWLAEVFGGPPRYAEERGGYPHMLGKHRGLGLTEEMRRRWVSLICDAADDPGCPTTRSSARPSWPTSSGARGWPWRTRSRKPIRRNGRRCRAGDGARRLRTGPVRTGWPAGPGAAPLEARDVPHGEPRRRDRLRLPARAGAPLAARIEAQPRHGHEDVALVRVDRDPAAEPRRAVVEEAA
jgi:truncated hemoglobin YjbI